MITSASSLLTSPSIWKVFWLMPRWSKTPSQYKHCQFSVHKTWKWMDSYIRIWDSGRKALQRCKWSHSQLASYHQNGQCGSCFMLFPMGWDGSEGRRMQFDSRNKYGTWVGKKSSWKNPKNASGKSEGHKWQTGGREKNSSTAAPSALLRVWSMRKCEFTCRAGQFCA